MTHAKDALPGIAILMLEIALSALDRASEARSVDDARSAIVEARGAIEQVSEVARKAAAADGRGMD